MNKLSKLFSAFILVALVVAFGACKKTYDAPPGPTDPNLVANLTIAQLKSFHTTNGAYDVINQDIIVSGIVVANDKSGNFYKQLFIQDTTGAIQLLVEGSSLYTSYPVGRRVFIRAKGLTLSDYNGTMELGFGAVVNGAPSVEAIPAGVLSNYLIGGSINNPVTPIPVTVSDLGTGMQNRYINALVKLSDFQFTNADMTKTYSDTSAYKQTKNLNIQNCSGSQLIVRTSAYANFAGIQVPGGKGDITFIYTTFGTTRQLVIRDTSDVQFTGLRCDGSTGGGGTPPGALLFETFESQTVGTAPAVNPIAISGWQNLSEVGNRTWNAKTFGGTKYAEATAFGSTQASVISWLVTPAINLTGTTKTLSFDSNQGYVGTAAVPLFADLKVLISTNYSGTGNPWGAGVTWTDLTSQAALSPGSFTSSFPAAFTNSGNINLNTYSGPVYIAFKYVGADVTGNKKTSTWQIDNIKVTAN